MWSVVATVMASTSWLSAATRVRAPLSCTPGPSGQQFDAWVTLPPTAAQGSTYVVRLDGTNSGTISHVGLNHIHDMMMDYGLPSGATYVSGSARVIPDTGTPNVAAGARVWHENGVIRMVLSGRVKSGSNYTPPSIEFRLRVDAPAGTRLALQFLRYQVTANAFLVGDVPTTCRPNPTPYTLGTTLVTASPSP